jgi:hypothetical protein
MFKFLLRFIPIKHLVNFLPEIIAYLLTKVLTYIFKKYPDSTYKAINITREVMTALTQNIDAAKDGVIDEKEVEKGIKLWKKVFD